MTQATTEAAEERKAREKLEQELAELRAKPPETKVEEPVKKVETQEEFDARLEAAAQAANEEAVAALAALPDVDQYDADAISERNKKVAGIWAKAHAKIVRAAQETRQTPMSKEALEALIDQHWESKETARQAARAKTDATTVAEKAWQSAVEFGAKAGLNLEDAESADHDLFMMAETKLPEELKGKGFTPEVGTWMVNYVRTRTGKVVLTEAEKEAAALKVQQENQVLGKGGVRPKPKSKEEQESPGSLSEDFNDARSRTNGTEPAPAYIAKEARNAFQLDVGCRSRHLQEPPVVQETP